MAARFEQRDSFLDIVADVRVLKVKAFDHCRYLIFCCAEVVTAEFIVPRSHASGRAS
jgi:hypothetical protein